MTDDGRSLAETGEQQIERLNNLLENVAMNLDRLHRRVSAVEAAAAGLAKMAEGLRQVALDHERRLDQVAPEQTPMVNRTLQ